LEKIIGLSSDSPNLRVEYNIHFSQRNGKAFLFVPEINLGGLSDETFAQEFGKENRTVNSTNTKISYKDLGVETQVFSPETDSIWMIPIKTVSLSEEGFESNLQGISVMPTFSIENDETALRASIELQMRSH